ncbi:MAG: hypothetical protein L6R42_000452 [Xanthoria sp. 1 TBL-2021]|nr:MAG: hypothetical protein L6R42_000452 [Xanthoria sp. 1 TBL-2021]
MPRARSREPLPRRSAREHPSASERARPVPTSPRVQVDRQEQEATKRLRPELRFTLPQAQVATSTAGTAKEARRSPTNPKNPTNKTDDELQKSHQKLAQLTRRKEEAEKAKDLATAADLTYYAIPDLEARIKVLLLQQRAEQDERAPQEKEDEGPYRTGIETENENSDDERGSGVEDLYD